MIQRTVVENSSKNMVIMDVFSKLAQERIIFIDDVITEELANGVIAQMLYLDSVDSKKFINIYINSPGGTILDGLAIYDVSKIIKSPIRTTCIGGAESMGAILMLMGQERIGLPHCRLMLHEASGYIIGKTASVKIDFELQLSLQKDIFDIVKEHTTITNIDEVLKFDKWFNAKEALECGLLTKIASYVEKDNG